MNIHKKITDMGFKRCDFYKTDTDYRTSKTKMVRDNVESKTERKDGKFVSVEVVKNHPKWDAFYCLQFTQNLRLWMYVEGQRRIREIWIDGDRVKNGVEEIYSWSNFNPPVQINSKLDLIKLFPKDIQRDFVLNSLFD
jgi:hypothetical protein